MSFSMGQTITGSQRTGGKRVTARVGGGNTRGGVRPGVWGEPERTEVGEILRGEDFPAAEQTWFLCGYGTCVGYTGIEGGGVVEVRHCWVWV